MSEKARAAKNCDEVTPGVLPSGVDWSTWLGQFHYESITRRDRARKLLRELDEKDKQQRRIKWQATKALISINEMVAHMSPAARTCWQAECETVKSFLEKIKDRGV